MRLRPTYDELGHAPGIGPHVDEKRGAIPHHLKQIEPVELPSVIPGRRAVEQEDREYAQVGNAPSLDALYEARDRIEMEYEDIGMEAFSRRAFALLAHAIRHMTPEQAVRLREHDKETVDFVAARPFANPHNNPALWTSYGRLHHGKPMRVSLEEAAKALPTI